MRHYFLTPITKESEAKGFFFCLYQDNLLFHPEDDPASVFNNAKRVFTDQESEILRVRIEEIYSVMDDPCDFILTMTEPDFQR